MNWHNVRPLLAHVTVQPGAEAPVPQTVPSEYREFLEYANGVEGFIGSEQYLQLWCAESLTTMNDAYAVTTYAPGIFLIGTDGSNTGFGIRRHDGCYVSVPLIGMGLDEITILGHSLEEFFRNLQRPLPRGS